MKKRKIAVIGVGHVGAHCAFALLMKGLADEIVLVDRNRQKAVSERQDLMDAAVCAPHRVDITIADYGELGDCDIIVNSVGKISLLETGKKTRLNELEYNIEQVNDYIPKVMAGGFSGIIVNITNPCDIITDQIARLSGLPKNHVFGTGTGLDTSRLLSELSRITGIDHRSITGYMMGEHGANIMFPMSQVFFGGIPLSVMAKKDKRFMISCEDMKNRVHDDAWVTFGGKKCTEYGICTTLVKAVEMIFHDEKAIMPVSAYLEGQYGRSGFYIGVPAIIGADGVEQIMELDLPEAELKLFQDCCDAVIAERGLQ